MAGNLFLENSRLARVRKTALRLCKKITTTMIAKSKRLFDNGGEVIIMSVAQDVRILNERIDAAFRRRYNTRYVLMASKVQADGAISFFMNISPKGHRRRSLPLHSLNTADLTYFEQVIAGVRAHTNLTIFYCGFGPKDYWPSTGRLIETRRRGIEISPLDW